MSLPHEHPRGRPNGRLGALAVLPFALALAVCLGLFAAVRAQLPDPVATHFDGLDGAADGFIAQGTFGIVSGAILVCTGALFGVIGTVGGTRSRWALVVGYGTAGVLGSALVATVLANRGADDAAAVHLPLWQVAVTLVAGCVLACVGWLLVRGMPPAGPVGHPGADRSDLGAELSADLADGRTAGWARDTGSWPLGGMGAAAVLGAVVTALVTPGWSLPVSLLAVGLLCLCFARLYVSVGTRGLTVAPALVPWPRIRVPLDAMAGAASRDIGAVRDFGGWGYRIRPGSSGVILRSGDALVVRRSSGREFAVTVEDAATAAALLNSLIERRRKR